MNSAEGWEQTRPFKREEQGFYEEQDQMTPFLPLIVSLVVFARGLVVLYMLDEANLDEGEQIK